MRRLIALLVLLICAPGVARAADAGDAPATPAELGVRLEKPAGDGVHFSQGSGVFLGNGLVLTAEHVVKYDPAHSAVTVLVDGVRTPGTIVFDGTKEGIDLALVKLGAEVLSVKRLAQTPVHVCEHNPAPSQKVVVAASGAVSDAATIPSPIASQDGTYITTGAGGETWTNILSTGYHPGNSGGGVFDPAHLCLWGILSFELGGKLGGNGPAVDFTAFVPATRIAPFLNEYVRAIAAHPDAASTK
jgi:hypothetical protein